MSKLAHKVAHRRFTRYRCSDCEASGRGWSERGHHLREGCKRGRRRSQSD